MVKLGGETSEMYLCLQQRENFRSR